MVLTKLKATSEAYLGHPVKSAVVTVPAYVNDAQLSYKRWSSDVLGTKV